MAALMENLAAQPGETDSRQEWVAPELIVEVIAELTASGALLTFIDGGSGS